MKSKVKLTITIALIATFGGVGIVETVGATPDGSQRLRGLGDRVFFVEVYDLFEGTSFDNCYFFLPDGTWIDPPFPAPGTWSQNSNGAKTSYVAGAIALDFDIGAPGNPFLVTLLLNQQGTVTPAGGKGTLQLWAFSQVIIPDFDIGVVGEFISVGYEVDECPIDF